MPRMTTVGTVAVLVAVAAVAALVWGGRASHARRIAAPERRAALRLTALRECVHTWDAPSASFHPARTALARLARTRGDLIVNVQWRPTDHQCVVSAEFVSSYWAQFAYPLSGAVTSASLVQDGWQPPLPLGRRNASANTAGLITLE